MNPLAVAAEWVLGSAVAGLALTPDGSPARAYISYGLPAWDECCEGGGQLVVAFSPPVFPTATFPALDTRTQDCGTTYVLPLVVELLRCAPTLDDDGEPPSTEDLQNAAVALTGDAWALLRAVQCALGTAYDGLITSLTPLPASGGCAGVALGLSLHLIAW